MYSMQYVNIDGFDLNLLRVLSVLLREQHVTRAAQQLGLSQAATSHALARLRRSFNDRLLVRAGRELQPTPEAERLQPIIEEILRLARESLSSPVFDPRTATTTFTVAMPDFLSAAFLPELIDRIRNQAPLSTLATYSLPAPPRFTRGGSVDATLIPASLVPASDPSTRVGAVRWIGLAATGNRAVTKQLSLKAFSALQHVVVDRAQIHERVDNLLSKHGYTRSVALQISNSELIPTVLDGTELVTIGWAQGPGSRNLSEFDLPFELPPTEYDLTWPHRLTNDAASTWLRQQVIAIASRHLA